MKMLKSGVLTCLIALCISIVSIDASAANSQIWWTGTKDVDNDYYHMHEGFTYYHQGRPDQKKIPYAEAEDHTYDENQVCIFCEHACTHSEASFVEGKKPTCTENGNIEYWSCPACCFCFEDEECNNSILLDDTIINALGHNFELGVCSRCHEGDGITGLSGKCGDDVSFWVNSTGEMHVYGSGPMVEYDSKSETPWDLQASSIIKVFVEPGVTSIGDYTFNNCSNLNILYIGQDVNTVGAHAFSACINLNEIYYYGTEAEWYLIHFGSENEALFSATIYFTLEPDIVLPASLTEIGEEAFSGCLFSYVKLSENTQSIGRLAFAECPNLTYVYIPETTTYIDRYAFVFVDGLTIFGKADSLAEKFAQDNNYTFVEVS